MSLFGDAVSGLLGQLDDYLAAVEELDGWQRAQLLTRPMPRLREGEQPIHGEWNTYMGMVQLECLVSAFKDASVIERHRMIAKARALKPPEPPPLPPGYSR